MTEKSTEDRFLADNSRFGGKNSRINRAKAPFSEDSEAGFFTAWKILINCSQLRDSTDNVPLRSNIYAPLHANGPGIVADSQVRMEGMRSIWTWLTACTLMLAIISIPDKLFAPVQWERLSPDELWEREAPQRLRLLMEDDLAARFEALGRSGQFNGAVAVSFRGKPLYSGAFGLADARRGDSLQTHHSFQLASVSKMFTATAVLLLAQDSALTLDDEVRCHLPEWPYEGMTLRHLLNHRSGLPRYMAVASWYWPEPKAPMSNADVVRQFAEHTPTTFFTPDHGFNYCNTNYVILAEVVARVAGMPFPEFLEQRIFEPLGMDHSYVYAKGCREAIPQPTYGHRIGRRGYYRAYQDYIDGVWGDKNIYASVKDMLRFDAALREGRLLRPEWLAQAWEPGSPQRRHNYGLGWRLINDPDAVLPYHFGWWRGYRSCYIHDRDSGLSLIILTNVDRRIGTWSYWDLFDEVKAMLPPALS